MLSSTDTRLVPRTSSGDFEATKNFFLDYEVYKTLNAQDSE